MRKLILPICILTIASSGACYAEEQEITTTGKHLQAEKTLEVAMKFMGAMSKGDMDTVMALMHEDMVWQNEGDSKLPWIGPWKGKKAIQEKFMPIFGENFKTVEWNPEDTMSSGDTAAFFGTMVGELTKSGEKTKKFSFALRVKVKDEKIILWNWFEDSFEVSRAYHAKKK